jgi:hypothetical protein
MAHPCNPMLSYHNGLEIVQPQISDDFMSELKKIALEYKEYFERKNNHINYVNLYQKNLGLHKYDYLLKYLKEIDPINADITKHNILYYGFIVSQPNNKNQYFHIDYKGKTVTYFIPLVNLSNKNGTEYLYFYDSSNYKKYFNIFIDITKVYITRDDVISYLEKHNLFNMKDYEFRFANTNAFSVIRLPHDVFHRGKINETSENRIMFQITIEMEPINFIQNEEFVYVAEDDDNEDL